MSKDEISQLIKSIWIEELAYDNFDNNSDFLSWEVVH